MYEATLSANEQISWKLHYHANYQKTILDYVKGGDLIILKHPELSFLNLNLF